MESNDANDLEARWTVLLDRIRPHAALLGKQGSVILKTSKSRRYWVLRFVLPRESEGRSRHCAIYVGREIDRELVRRTRNLLRHYRDQRSCVREIAILARIAATWTAVLRRHHRRSQM